MSVDRWDALIIQTISSHRSEDVFNGRNVSYAGNDEYLAGSETAVTTMSPQETGAARVHRDQSCSFTKEPEMNTEASNARVKRWMFMEKGSKYNSSVL